jgi:hypothetical protein
LPSLEAKSGATNAETVFPDFAALHPGYEVQITLRQTAAFNHAFITKN